MSSLHKHLINEPQDLVLESLRGVQLTNPAVVLDEQHKVIYQRNLVPGRVAIISGGGSGHEPAHASFVGPGILSAAVAGSVFASPNVSQIRHALDLVSPKSQGTLVVVKRYTGDLFHFGLSVEKYRATAAVGAPDARIVVVGDDVAVGRTQGAMVGRRGLAGTVLVYKIAGALAAQGASLDAVEAIAQFVADSVATIGVGLEHVHVPGTEASAAHLAPDELELGLGIHNEPGFKHLKPYPPLKALVAQMMESITSTEATDPERGFLSGSLKGDGKDEIVLLVNNLGGTSPLELGGITNEVALWLHKNGYIVRRILSGTYMTSLNMPGFSVTLLALPRGNGAGVLSSARILELLDAPGEAPGWAWHARTEPNFESKVDTEQADPVAAEKKPDLPLLTPEDPKALVSAIRRAASALIKAEPEITRQDTIAGDGDAGLTLKAGAEGIIKAINAQHINGTNVIADILAIAEVVDVDMGGTSGALYSIFFSALGASLRASVSSSEGAVTPGIWGKGAEEALAVLYKYTRARPPSRTLVDPLAAFVQSLQSQAESSTSKSTFATAVAAAHSAAEATRTLKAKAGRGAYVDQKALAEQNVPDPGAWGVWVILEALLADA